MFRSKERYVTRRVNEEVPILIQGFLWYLIDEEVTKGRKLDYFQVFEIEAVDGGIKVLHTQEQPAWSQEVFLPVVDEDRINQKIWVIDTGYQTMLFPEEY